MRTKFPPFILFLPVATLFFIVALLGVTIAAANTPLPDDTIDCIPNQPAEIITKTAPIDPMIGRVWHDGDLNGLREQPPEVDYPSIAVALNCSCHYTNGSTIFDGAQVFTDMSGYYLFNFLTPMNEDIELNCELRVIVPAGSQMTEQDVGQDDTIDSDFDPLTHNFFFDIPNGDQAPMYVDAGLVGPPPPPMAITLQHQASSIPTLFLPLFIIITTVGLVIFSRRVTMYCTRV